MNVQQSGLRGAVLHGFLLSVMVLTIGMYLLGFPSTLTVAKIVTAEKRIELLSAEIAEYRKFYSSYPATLAILFERKNAQIDTAKFSSILNDPWGYEWTYTLNESADNYILASHYLDVSRKDVLKKNALQFLSVLLFVASALVLVICTLLCCGCTGLRRCLPLFALLLIILLAFGQSQGSTIPILSSVVTCYAELVISVLLFLLSVVYMRKRYVTMGIALLLSAVFAVVVLLSGVT